MQMPTQKPHNKKLKISLEAENATCSICLNIWHDVVTVGPCLHNFCNGCISKCIRQSQDMHSDILCPNCKAVIQFVGRNYFIHDIVEHLLKADTSLRRMVEDIEDLDSFASIKSPLMITLKRMQVPTDEGNSEELACLQCGAEFAGYQCTQRTIHLQCHACGGFMPSRRNLAIPQYCLGCDKAFCGAYWHGQGVIGSHSRPVCGPEIFKPIAERTISRVPLTAHEKNHYEQYITENCIWRMGRTLQDIITEWITKWNNKEIDRRRMPLNCGDMISHRTYTCNECYSKFMSFLLFWFRVTLPKEYLPPEAREREDCSFGLECLKQHHNGQHTREKNHVCWPSRRR